jgi:hypothetical protein
MGLYRISTCPAKPNDLFDPIPLSGNCQTLLQYRSNSGTSPTISEYTISVIGDNPGSVLLELIEVDEAAVVQPFDPLSIIKVDEHAVKHSGEITKNPNFDLENDEAKGCGFAASDEGDPITEVRSLDSAVVPVNTQFVRQWSTVNSGSGQFTRVVKFGPVISPGKVVRLRVKPLKADPSLRVLATLVVDC